MYKNDKTKKKTVLIILFIPHIAGSKFTIHIVKCWTYRYL